MRTGGKQLEAHSSRYYGVLVDRTRQISGIEGRFGSMGTREVQWRRMITGPTGVLALRRKRSPAATANVQTTAARQPLHRSQIPSFLVLQFREMHRIAVPLMWRTQRCRPFGRTPTLAITSYRKIAETNAKAPHSPLQIRLYRAEVSEKVRLSGITITLTVIGVVPTLGAR
jgi:hypothetical protein